jgi:hypothetical protein
MQSKEIGEKIMCRTPYGVRVEGTLVVMTIGPKAVTMPYEVAFKLSAFLRNGGRLAKKAAGDQSRIFTPFANLTDANLDELEAQRSRDGTAVYNGK